MNKRLKKFKRARNTCIYLGFSSIVLLFYKEYSNGDKDIADVDLIGHFFGAIILFLSGYAYHLQSKIIILKIKLETTNERPKHGENKAVEVIPGSPRKF